MLNAVPDRPGPPSTRRASGAFTGNGIKRTIDLLRVLENLQNANNGREVYLREIASAAGLPLGTTRRYLETMAHPDVDVVRQPKFGTYTLTWRAPTARAQAHPSKRILARLTQLQGQTGQVAMLFTPYLLNHRRQCTEIVWGTHKPMWDDGLETAPLDADAPGLVMQAAMHDWSRAREESAYLLQIRDAGFAISPAPGGHHDLIAAPLMRGPILAGAVAIMPLRHLMESPRRRTDYVHAVLDAAGAMSGHLGSQAPTRPYSERLPSTHREQTCTPTGGTRVPHRRSA
ncbi:helix-turn-helix domain-containing protein [Streptomyces lydicus]|uniref:helix-turn-helix domain-containing protein n=1 Tax=Streptomyces lydicus TaxID=47763 RepID=UPI0010117B0E|nr:helix-turn-helix domain-containing protein [Streptomyces lydicus]MCZ1012081.1 helix-turn-helix domain-containing protein [Streptomyces lydicus]